MATLKQKLAVKHIANGDSVRAAMRKAGYSPNTADNPDHLLNRKGFAELLEQLGVTDLKIGERINEGLDATRTVVMGKDSNEAFVDIQPDYLVRHKYIETTLRLKGHLKNNEGVSPTIINMPILGGASVHVNTSDKEAPTAPETS